VPVVSEPLDDLLDLAEELARRAGALLLKRLADPRTEVSTKSSATDMVTEIDRLSERLIVDGIRAARPRDAILAEESGELEGSSGLRWVVDPLDGTTNYLYGHPGFAVSIAVERDGRSIVAVVNDPVHSELFTAVSEGGARRNGVTIRPSQAVDLGTALVATGFAYDPARRRAQAAVLERVLPRIRDIRRMGAAAVDLCSVACGRVDAYYERGLEAWDLSAGLLIAAEAGASVGAIGGGPAVPGSAIAAPPALFEPLRALLVEAGATAHV
jgi:myo-inositol-1(or 4)-monophosphatase